MACRRSHFGFSPWFVLLTCLLLFLTADPGLGSQDTLNVFTHISSSDEFALNPITAIAQDEHGHMWFGSRNGLLRHDGLELTKYLVKKGAFVVDDVNDIVDIAIFSDGRIWLASRGGLHIFDPSVNSFTTLPGSPGRMTKIVETGKGEALVGTVKGLFAYTPDSGFDRIEALDSISINSFYRGSAGEALLGTNGGFYRLTGDGSSRSVDRIGDIGRQKVMAVYQSKRNDLWVGTVAGLRVVLASGEPFGWQPSVAADELERAHVRALVEDGKGRIWAATYDGIFVVEPDGRVIHLRHDTRNPQSLSDNKIRCLFRGQSGSIWAGSYYGGINLWNERPVNFSLLDEGSGNGLGHRVVSSVQIEEKGLIYIGTEGEGVTIFDPASGEYRYLDQLADGSKVGTVKSLLLDESEHLWIGTFGKGLIDYNLGEGTHKRYLPGNSPGQSLSDQTVLSLALGPEGDLWVGYINGSLDRIERNTGKVSRVINVDDVRPTDHLGAVRILKFDLKGLLYLGLARGFGTIAVNAREPGGINLLAFGVRNDATKQFSVTDILVGRDGTIYVATQDAGVLRVARNELVRLELPATGSVYSLVEGAFEKELWMSSQRGVLHYQPGMNETRIYTGGDGLPLNEFSRATGLRSKDGRVYFGGASGLTSFHPQNLGRTDNYVPDVVITGFNLLDQPLSVGDGTGILDHSIVETRSLYLAYNQNNFTIRYALPNFGQDGENTYQYRLVGLDENWTRSTANGVTYTIQRGGDYTFEVRGENPGGIATEDVTRLGITVGHPPWRTWWAYLLYATAILVLVYVLNASNSTRLRLQHRIEMESREHVRLQEANDQKLNFFTNISHEFRTPLTLIAGSLERILDGFRGSSSNYRQLLVVKNSTDQLYRLINELLDFRKLENKQMILRAAEGNLVKFVREIFLSFQQQAIAAGYIYHFVCEAEDIQVFYDRDKLEKVTYNLIANAFRYTPPGGEVVIALEASATSVVLSVTDNGDGIPPELTKRIFDRFYSVPDQRIYGQFLSGSGIGLAIAKSVVDLHHGELGVISAVGGGSTFTVTLPRGSDHLSADEIIADFTDSENISGYEGSRIVPELLTFPAAIIAPVENDIRPLVLVAEDNEAVSRLIHDILSSDYRLLLVGNGRVGYERAIAAQPDLIISDVMMPEMDGIAFCALVKQDIRTSHIPFMLLTARTSLIHKYDGLESGADAYLGKPFRVKEMLLYCENMIRAGERIRDKIAASGGQAQSLLPLNSLDEEMMEKAFAIIEKNLANEAFNIGWFSDELGTSRSLLFTKFRAWTGKTPNDYIRGARMQRAATLIESGKFNVSEIAYRVGYRDPGYFAKSFRKHFSMTPSEYAVKFAGDVPPVFTPSGR